MKAIICRILFFIGFCSILGIIGGIDNGEPLTNIWWVVPIVLVMWVSNKVGKIFS